MEFLLRKACADRCRRGLCAMECMRGDSDWCRSVKDEAERQHHKLTGIEPR